MKLREHGIVQSHLVQDVTSVYTFTKNPRLRETVRECVDRLPSSAEQR